MKEMVKITAVISLIVCLAAPAFAIEGGNPKKGKYLYKKSCKVCHSAGDEGGEVTPMNKTQAQWDRFFSRDKHRNKPEVLENISEQDLLDINQFLHDHAVDSPQPQTCG